MKCASFRTAEDYRDHLPCYTCEPHTLPKLNRDWKYATPPNIVVKCPNCGFIQTYEEETKIICLKCKYE